MSGDVMRRTAGMAAAALASFAAAGAHAANIVQDPGFEAGGAGNTAFWTFKNWVTGPDTVPVP